MTVPRDIRTPDMSASACPSRRAGIIRTVLGYTAKAAGRGPYRTGAVTPSGKAARVSAPQAVRMHRCARCPATPGGEGSGRSWTCRAASPADSPASSAPPQPAQVAGRWSPMRSGTSRGAGVLPAWPLCPPGVRPPFRRDRWRSFSASAVGFAGPSPGGGLPLLELSGPGRRPGSAMRAAWAATVARSRGARRSGSHATRAPPSGRTSRSPDARNRRRFPSLQACLSRLLLVTAASAVLVGRPVKRAAPIARQDHDGCAAGLERT